MEEIWKDVEGYEGIYQVSNLGRVKSLARLIEPSNGKRPYWIYECIMSQYKESTGYMNVKLSKNGRHKSAFVHRLVAQAFHPNPDNLREVNHKDENKTNNRVDNLEWCSTSYNVQYGTSMQRRKKTMHVPILCYDLNGNLVKEYESLSQACEELSLGKGNLWKALNNRIHSLGGYRWKYKE